MAVFLVGACAFGGLDVDQVFLDGLVDGDFCPVLSTLVFRLDVAVAEATLEMPGIERFARRTADGPRTSFAVLAPIKIENAAFRADWFTVDQNQSRIWLSVLLYDGDNFPVATLSVKIELL